MAASNSMNMDEAGVQTFNTTTGNLTGSATTQYNVLVGDSSNKLTNVAPSATSGVPLISQGAASNPAFGTAVVVGGGTGATSFTEYSVLCGGTTSTGAVQNVSGVGSAGEVLTSNGAGQLPTWQPASGGSGILTATGTLTSSQIKNLHGTPIQAIADPGPGNAIVIIDCVSRFNYGGTNAFVAGSGQRISLYFGISSLITSGTNYNGGDFVINAILTSTSNVYTRVPISIGTGRLTSNAAVNFYNSNATEISGNAANNNTVTWEIVYYITSV